MDKRSFFSNPSLFLNADYKISVVIPWRETESRLPAFNLICDVYSSALNNPEIITSDSGSSLFNLSASRNVGLKKAFDDGADVVVLSDADVFVSSDALIESIYNSLNNNVITNPYDLFLELTKDSTEMFFNNDASCMSNYSWIGEAPVLIDGKPSSLIPCSGINIIPRSVWENIGGFDENFVGWGYEDNAYLLSYLKHYNDLYKFTNGVALSVFHEKEWQSDSLDNGKYFKENYIKEIE